MISSDADKDLTLLDETLVRFPLPSWMELDATEAVREWIAQPQNNFGLFVKVSNANERQMRAGNVVKQMNCSFASEIKLSLAKISP